MIVRVHLQPDDLLEHGRVVKSGDRFSAWLTFEESGRFPAPAELSEIIAGHVTPLPHWPGQTHGRHPCRTMQVVRGLYWEAPEPITGPVTVHGVVRYNGLDAPDGFPETVGLVKTVFMERRGNVVVRDETWFAAADYEAVESTTLMVSEADTGGTAAWTGVVLDLAVGTDPNAIHG